MTRERAVSETAKVDKAGEIMFYMLCFINILPLWTK